MAHSPPGPPPSFYPTKEVFVAAGAGGSGGVVNEHHLDSEIRCSGYITGWRQPLSPEEQMWRSRQNQIEYERAVAESKARIRSRRNNETGRVTEMQIWKRVLRKHTDRVIIWGAYVLTGWAVLLSFIITTKLFMWLSIAILGG